MDKILILQIVAGVLIGGSIGAVLGYMGKCSTGTCPLTANPLRGSLYGAFLGILFATTLGGSQRAVYAENTAALHIDSPEAFQSQVLDSQQPVLLDFYSAHCPPCHQLAPTIESLAQRYEGRAVVAKIDVRKLPDLARQFNIYGTPTVVILNQGQEVSRQVGVAGEKSYASQLDELLRSS